VKRDWDLIRELLHQLEHRCGPIGANPLSSFEVEIEGRCGQEILYHLVLLNEAGLIVAKDLECEDEWWIYRLTWQGHDFLDAARNDTIWSRAKGIAADKGAGLTFAVLKDLLVRIARDALFGG
jgi:hypothetical protein